MVYDRNNLKLYTALTRISYTTCYQQYGLLTKKNIIMKLIINDKMFVGRYNDKQELVISLYNDVDIQFFKEWVDRNTMVKLKKDRVKDIQIFKTNETGILRNCFPIFNLNEDEVKIVYDYYNDRKLFEETTSELDIFDVSCRFCGSSNFDEYKLNVRKKTKVYSNGLEQWKDDVIKIKICECGVVVKNDN